MRIFHISDVHIHKFLVKPVSLQSFIMSLHHLVCRIKHWFADLHIRTMMDMIKLTKPDVIVFSGDASVAGHQEEYNLFVSRVFAPIQAMGIPMLVVPGNHDCFSETSSQCFFNTISHNIAHLKKVYSFLCLENDEIDVYRSKNIFFICLDTTSISSIWRNFGGYVSFGIARKLDSVLKYIQNKHADAFIVVINHFPIKELCLSHANRLKSVLTKSNLPCLYLCGHKHSAFTEKISNNCFAICAGSVTHADKGNFFIIDIVPCPAPHKLDISSFVWNKKTSNWTLHYSHFPVLLKRTTTTALVALPSRIYHKR